MVYVNNSNELYHYGVKGMRWGHRKASYQNTAVKTGVSAQRQKYLNAKAAKKTASRDFKKAYDKAYNRSIAAISPFKKHRQANDERWNDAFKKAEVSRNADKAYKDAKKEYHQTDEYKAKRAKAIKVGAAVAGTALAAYGAYKVSKVLKDKASTRSYENGKAAMERWMASAKKQSQAGNWQRSNEFYMTAREVAANADRRTDRVKNSTVEAAKYLWKTRGGRWAGV